MLFLAGLLFAAGFAFLLALANASLSSRRRHDVLDSGGGICEEHNEVPSNAALLYSKLTKRYFAAYLPAAFADWLQGPYIYRLYVEYGYSDEAIAQLYVVGFASSVAFGIAIGALADQIGRKKICVAYSVLYSLCCLCKLSKEYHILLIGRIFGGVSTSILFSTFEAWYIHEHVERLRLPHAWLGRTFARATILNAWLAIVAGFTASLAVDSADLGPIAPYLLAVPCLTIAGFLVAFNWNENQILSYQGGGAIWPPEMTLRKHPAMLLLGAVQALFEAVMYTFVFLWTPVLTPLKPPLGLAFATFMMCIMAGSEIYSYLVEWTTTRAQHLLTTSITLAAATMITATVATYGGVDEPRLRWCYVSFLFYELAVGMYFPAMGYLRSQVVPEPLRATIINWFRVPMNLLTCVSLLWFRHPPARIVEEKKDETPGGSFLFCTIALLIAWICSKAFSKVYKNESHHYKINNKSHEPLLIDP